MEKTQDNIRGLVKKVFGLNRFFGKVTNERGGLIVWNKSLIPSIAVIIFPENDAVYVNNRKYEQRAKEFAEIYRKEFLKGTEQVTLKSEYY